MTILYDKDGKTIHGPRLTPVVARAAVIVLALVAMVVAAMVVV